MSRNNDWDSDYKKQTTNTDGANISCCQGSQTISQTYENIWILCKQTGFMIQVDIYIYTSTACTVVNKQQAGHGDKKGTLQ